MWRWLASLWRRWFNVGQEGELYFYASTDPDMENDPFVNAVVRRCYATGNVLIGNRRSDGSWDIEEIPPEKDDETV